MTDRESRARRRDATASVDEESFARYVRSLKREGRVPAGLFEGCSNYLFAMGEKERALEYVVSRTEGKSIGEVTRLKGSDGLYVRDKDAVIGAQCLECNLSEKWYRNIAKIGWERALFELLERSEVYFLGIGVCRADYYDLFIQTQKDVYSQFKDGDVPDAVRWLYGLSMEERAKRFREWCKQGLEHDDQRRSSLDRLHILPLMWAKDL